MNTLRTCVFPCAGFGTRFFPATKVIPKEMLPLVDKPILQYGIEEARDSGLDKLIIVTSKGKDTILDHFDRTAELERSLQERGKNDLLAEVDNVSRMVDLISVRQKEALGLGHAVLTAKRRGRRPSVRGRAAGRRDPRRRAVPAADAARVRGDRAAPSSR